MPWKPEDYKVGILVGIATFIALCLFIGIVWWAFSRGRADANREASMLPFDLPDELNDNKKEESDE